MVPDADANIITAVTGSGSSCCYAAVAAMAVDAAASADPLTCKTCLMVSISYASPRQCLTGMQTQDKKECVLAHSRAEARLPKQPSTLAPSAHPRGAFLFHRTHFPMKQEKSRVRDGHETLSIC